MKVMTQHEDYMKNEIQTNRYPQRFYERPVEDAIVMSKMYTEGNIC